MRQGLLVGLSVLCISGNAWAMVCPANIKSVDDIRTLVSKQSDIALGAEKEIKIKDDVDFNSDGINDIIASPSYSCGNAGCDNHLFLKGKDKSFSYAGHAFFHHDGYSLTRGVGPFQLFGIIAYIRSSADEGSLVRYENYGCMMEKITVIDGKSKELFNFIKPPVHNMM